jgi:hypothetical protein
MAQDYPVLEESTVQGEEWVHKCGTVLLGARVHHTIRDGLFPLSGGGDVSIEIVPYCPECQEEPSPYGTPVREDPAEASEREILRRMSNR